MMNSTLTRTVIAVVCAVPVAAPGFVRVEILRAFIPGIPRLPALISNPIYFDGG